MQLPKNVLLIKCNKCKVTFRSPIGGDINSLISAALVNNTIQCPHCRFMLLTSKPDFFYVDDNGVEQSISFKGGFNG